jgi:hypothetical protein
MGKGLAEAKRGLTGGKGDAKAGKICSNLCLRRDVCFLWKWRELRPE